LTELRAADLRFTPDEAAEFLNQVMGLSLSPAEMAALEARTEGWIAGLQLAALSMQGRTDTAAFVRSFAGSHRFVLDYLVEEVLLRQPERVRAFLLQTSILDRLSGPLCDAVTGQEGSGAVLEALERGNLFIVPLDDSRRWVRYHHLFAEVLQARLLRELPERAPALHRRASAWYERNGLPAAAIRHALAAQDFERAAGLLELQTSMMRAGSQEALWKSLVQALPAELVRARPVLSVYYAFALLPAEMDAAEARLQDAERWLQPAAAGPQPEPAPAAEVDPPGGRGARGPSQGMVVVNQEEFRSLPGTIAIARAYCAGALDDLAGTLRYARLALDLLPAGDWFWRGAAAALLGIASWRIGDLEAAYRAVAEGMASTGMASGIGATTGFMFLLADIRLAQGRLRDAMRTCQQGLRLVAEQVNPLTQGAAELHVILSEVTLEQDELEAAAQHLLRSKELGEVVTLQEARHRWHVAKARLEAALGNLDLALDLLEEAQRLAASGPTPEYRPIAALKARVWIRQGNAAAALEWGRARGLSIDDEPSYGHEFEHITLARAYLADPGIVRDGHAVRAVIEFLERLLPAAEAGGRLGNASEILALHALAYEMQGDRSLALASLARALALAEAEGAIRLFVDQGPPMARLLAQAAARGIAPDATARLLAAFAAQAPQPAGDVYPPASTRAQPLIEPLSERELEVLRLIAEGLSNQAIGERLFLALDTVKGHNRHIFDKLQVQRRTEAVARARELGLL
jgi:LuxR family maltose regulon positive regulatory protein